MAKDAVATMGDLLPDDAGGRDAVHVAVFSAVSDEKLFPGQDIAIIERGEPDNKVTAKPPSELIAIVDPFLKAAVPPGARFWAYLYPRTITSLSHRWGHPGFADAVVGSAYTPPSAKVSSEQWLRNFCATNDCPSYEEVMGAVARV